jgi:hypothetical protein
MAEKNSGEVIHQLAFPLHEMLDLPESVALKVDPVSSGSTAVTLRVTILDSPGGSFFVKTMKAGGGSGSHYKLGTREVQFYGLIDTLISESYPNIPKCINHFINEEQDNYYLVLEDLSESYQSHEAIDFSQLENWQVALSALADFHKCFTNRLTAEQIQTHADASGDVESYIQKLERAYDQFQTDQRGLVAEPVLALMRRLIPLIRVIELDKAERVHKNELTTILHRDAHVKNFLYPHSPDAPAMLVDWQFWSLGIGTYDLRHLLGSALRVELRPHQVDLVRYYYEHYRDGLDVAYPWSDCWLDYRKGIIDNLFMPVWQYTGFGWDVGRWGKTLKAAVENYQALGCDQIEF